MTQHQFFKNILLTGLLLLLIITVFDLVEKEKTTLKPRATNSALTLDYLNNSETVLELSGKVFSKESNLQDTSEITQEYWLALDRPLLINSGLGTHYVEEILLNPSRFIRDEGFDEYLNKSVVLAGKLEWGPAESRMLNVFDLYSK